MVNQLPVIQPHLMQEGSVKIVHADSVLSSLVPDIVGSTVDKALFQTAGGEEKRTGRQAQWLRFRSSRLKPLATTSSAGLSVGQGAPISTHLVRVSIWFWSRAPFGGISTSFP